ncbi:hypothetical protein ABFS82_06G154200 [Erythranthe guttata]
MDEGISSAGEELPIKMRWWIWRSGEEPSIQETPSTNFISSSMADVAKPSSNNSSNYSKHYSHKITPPLESVFSPPPSHGGSDTALVSSIRPKPSTTSISEELCFLIETD